MKWLRKLLDSQEPLFKEKGKLEKLYPLYEAADTFLYTPGETTRGPSHVRDALDLKRMMSIVVVALLPCVIMACYNTGYQASLGASNFIASTNAQAVGESYDLAIQSALGWRSLIAGLPSPDSFWGNLLLGATYFLPVYIVCMTAGGLCEVLFSIIRKHEVNEGFLVTGLLFPLTLPPSIPLWQVAVGIIFGVVIGKEVFGGTGRNFLNPALTARAFLYFAYPAQSSGDKVWNAFGNVVIKSKRVECEIWYDTFWCLDSVQAYLKICAGGVGWITKTTTIRRRRGLFGHLHGYASGPFLLATWLLFHLLMHFYRSFVHNRMSFLPPI